VYPPRKGADTKITKDIPDVRAKIDAEAADLKKTLVSFVRFLYENPETAFQEFKAAAEARRLLEEAGFTTEPDLGGLETAFRARPPETNNRRPRVSFLAEYDALPEIGHGCGHNLIAAAAVGAALVLNRTLVDFGVEGGVEVIGTPAEEGGGGKIKLIEAGVFAETDAAMMFHPHNRNAAGEKTLGRIQFRAVFHGRTAHAAACPEMGRNALDGLIGFYNHMAALRQHIPPDARIHGIITDGGTSPSIIPETATGRFYVRAADPDTLTDLFDRVSACARGAATATGTHVDIETIGPVYTPMHRNPPLEATLRDIMEQRGLAVTTGGTASYSTDAANVSRVVPTLHPTLALVNPEVPIHSAAFAAATIGPEGEAVLETAVKMLAETAFVFLTGESLRQEAAATLSTGG
jgi:amidohydrolase